MSEGKPTENHEKPQEEILEDDHQDKTTTRSPSAEEEAENGGEPEEIYLEEPEEELSQEEETYKDRFTRLMADYENFRRRSAKERAQERQRGRRDAAEKLLPVFDSLSAGMITLKEDDPSRKGLEAVFGQLVTAFEKAGIQKVETVSHPFDPDTMEAIAQIPHPEIEDGIVVDESRAGFVDDVGLVRAAQVVVSSGKA